jgi:hypothetical protein
MITPSTDWARSRCTASKMDRRLSVPRLAMLTL